MKMITFASINIGSYDVGMKIFELSKKHGMREIDYIRKKMELGKESYASRRISDETLDGLCKLLLEFISIMKEYQVEDYRCCTTSSIREAANVIVILDHIKVRTGIKVEVLSNSEQRFLSYKSIASIETEFNKIIQKETTIVDVGGGSIQISLFDKDALVSTQNIRLGSLRIREKLGTIEDRTLHLDLLIEELVDNEIYDFKKLYLKEAEIQNMIAIGDYIPHMVKVANKGEDKNYLTREGFMEFCKELRRKIPEEISAYLGIPPESASLVIPSVIVYKRIIEVSNVELIWTPGITLEDGIAYDYAENARYIRNSHNFENDILAAAKNIGKRYLCDKNHCQELAKISLLIFDCIKKIHGLGKRNRLLLEIAALLHDCGKYISMFSRGECGYNIIMATEMIGLSHKEREIVANVVKYNTVNIPSFEAMPGSMDSNTYLVILKLVSILRVSNSLDRSHKQKFKNLKAAINGKKLILTIDTLEDITLEYGLFPPKADFFEDIYGIRPVIRKKKSII